ncbi:sensor histidine kinase [Desulfohalovibrio reitneri]|uniref:sensor histidine kinase n=1 Tax=Desulfohalovibrio reitneri TaxID=1307759 RepID=UPI0004A750E1|nr:HAMP domain-containing sensor histidine kinase [Desulfohalovibrio reitneri]
MHGDSSGIGVDSALGSEQVLAYAQDFARVCGMERERRRELERRNAELTAIIGAMGEAVVVTDASMRIVWANPVVERMAGCPLAGEGLSKALPEGQRSLRLLEELASTGKADTELEYGKRVYSARARRFDEQGCVVVFTDMTARRRAESMKNEFVALLSHELKTPLNGILGFSELLRDDDVPVEEVKEYSGYIRRQAKQMQETVESLLRFADLHGGRIETRSDQVSVFSAVKAARDQVKEEASRRKASLQLRLVGPEPKVRGNPELLTDLFRHLLHNAVVHAGGIIRVETQRDGDSVRVGVSDNGPGIAEEDMDWVFQGFCQEQEFLTRACQGLGLGLTLVKQICQLHDGEVALRNRSGGGLCCVVVLPLPGEEEVESNG